ncbi:ATP-dependent DNA helicase [Ammonifex thiophilus]|uniref:ATP-dependent DNA helicase n=1 Tax=Ammonifex thiophilus TaxID=444093 RepID=UPI00106C9F72|nr:ATP-dependent DNA helicase [Ammonifex thiophilus]
MSSLLRTYLFLQKSIRTAPDPDPASGPDVSRTFSRLAIDVILSAPGLKRRDGQLRMAETVAQVLAGERPERAAAVEAGTGTGKSLAYLVPVMLYCVREGRRAVVATGTKNLQEQLATKDAPFAAELVEKATGKSPTFAVVYGRANYLCPALLEERLAELEGKKDRRGREGQELEFLRAVVEWWRKGGSGLRDSLPSEPPEESWWLRVSADDDGADCRECRKTGCPFARAREAASTAHVVITNHHLVAADWKVRQVAGLSLFAGRGDVLPSVLVIDEAHDFLDALRSSLSVSFTAGRVKRLETDIRSLVKDLESLVEDAEEERREGNGKGSPGLQASRGAREGLCVGVGEGEDLWKRLEDLFACAEEFRRQRKAEALLLFPPPLFDSAGSLLPLLQSRFSSLLDYADWLFSVSPVDGKERKKFERKLERFRERLLEVSEAFRRAVLLERHYRTYGPPGDACWYEENRFCAVPVDVSRQARDLWSDYRHVVLTSATLFPFPQSEGFSWFREAYGFEEGEIALGILPSLFDYGKQMRAYILARPELEPEESRKGKDGNGEDRAEHLAESLLELVNGVSGGVLALFTSYQEMRRVASLVKPRLPKDRLLLIQGEAGRYELLQRFKEHGRGVLLGVSSFWQGVDVPGEALSAVFIARIPFPHPEDPVVEALTFLAGREWFVKVSRPIAALTLRQGIGRLIRTEDDTGVVVIADPRAAGKHRRLVESCLPVEPEVKSR